ncbi:MAG TPA: cytochrome c peroxidase [Pyrinomonadaceae bacterium]|nr:cytochrome c peroxidase [Pyrinomonadaceae bacterium]
MARWIHFRLKGCQGERAQATLPDPETFSVDACRSRSKADRALLVLLAILIWVPSFSAATPTEPEFKPPTGISADIWSYFVPKDNPLTSAKIELGKKLFFDPRLSADGTVSCSSCHDPNRGFADGRRLAIGVGGRFGSRNTPTVLNAMFSSTLFWDGRVDSLEAQALEPLVNPDEMGNATHADVVSRVATLDDYNLQFNRVFGRNVNIDAISKAIAAYERTLVSANSPYDRFLTGDRNALNEGAQRGLTLFRGKARCSVCHSLNASFPFFTDGNYRNTGVAGNFANFDALIRSATGTTPDARALTNHDAKSALGRFAVTGNAIDIGSFRTPMLRNIELTAPYFHDGSAATLADVVRYYARGGNENASRDWELQSVNLTESEQLDLIDFLKSLTSDDMKPH